MLFYFIKAVSRTWVSSDINIFSKVFSMSQLQGKNTGRDSYFHTSIVILKSDVSIFIDNIYYKSLIPSL